MTDEHADSPNAGTPPSIEIHVSSDNMSASLSVMPVSNQTGNITADEIFDKLNEKKIVFGVEEHKILAINNRVKRVDHGDLAAKRGPRKKGEDGQDIFGRLIENKDYLDTQEIIGHNIAPSDDSETYRSNITGIVTFFDNTLDVVQVDFNAKFLITVAKDLMSATGIFLPPGEKGAMFTSTMITAALHENHVSSGILESVIQDVVNSVNANGEPVADLVIARGQPAIHGSNGKIEYFFATGGSLKPKHKEDGSVDFKELSIIITAAEGQELARLHPPTKGTPGHDITGKELSAMDGSPLKLPAGPNTGAHAHNPDILIALKSGNVSVKGSLVEVSEGYSINGDVDFSTGNIHYGQSVHIRKDIKSGFDVIVGGDLDIGGIVEDAKINAQGNVLIKQGFLGSGKGEIVANGSVNVGFIRNQTIKAKGDVVVAKEAINAHIYARNCVTFYGKSLSAVGGKISAYREIEGFVFGNLQGTRTELEVGVDFTLIEEKYKTEEKIKELGTNKKKVEENLDKFEKMKKLKKALQPKQEFLYKKLMSLLEKITAQLDALQKRKEMIEQKITSIGKARILVKDRLYPGVFIKIGDRNFPVQNEVVGKKTIMLVDGDIKFL